MFDTWSPAGGAVWRGCWKNKWLLGTGFGVYSLAPLHTGMQAASTSVHTYPRFELMLKITWENNENGPAHISKVKIGGDGELSCKAMLPRALGDGLSWVLESADLADGTQS